MKVSLLILYWLKLILIILWHITGTYILKGLASYQFYQYYCLNRVYAEIDTFLPPFSKRLFIAMIHRKVYNIKTVNIQYMWRKFLRNIREYVSKYISNELCWNKITR